MKKIKLKISLIVTLLSLVIIFFLSNTAILTNKKTAETLAAQSFPLIAEALANDVNGFILQNISLIETLANVPEFKTDMPLLEKADILKNLTQSVAKDDVDFAVFDLSGRLITISGIELDCSAEYYYTEVVKTKKTVIGHVVLSPASNEFSFMITTPIMTNGLMTGIIGAAIPMVLIDQKVNAVTMGSTGYVFLTDTASTIISHPDTAMVRSRYNIDRQGESNSVSFSQFGRELIANKTGFTEYEFGDGRRSAAFATVPSTDWRLAIAIGQKELFAGTERAMKICFLVAFLALAVSIVAGYLFGNSMSKPIVAVTNEVVKLKEGDLTIDVKATTKDEIGVMTTALIGGVSSLRSLIVSVFEETDAMKHMGQNLSANTEQTASAVNQISANIESIKAQVINQSAGVEETQATIEQIVRNIERLNGDIEKQVQNVENSSSATEEMIANIASITRILEKNTVEVSNLGQAAKQGRDSLEQTTGITEQIASESDGLLEASSIIEGIAAQTNLLAMNAAIEAAHAGEAGKGFAVVADEIRKLAENAGAQSKSITQVLHKLKNDIEKLTDSAAFVQQQFVSIYDLTQAVQDQERSVTSMMQEQGTANVQVLQSIQQISEITASVKQGSSQMLHGSREISIEMNKIAEVTRVVNDSMNEMVVGTQEINRAMQDVNLLTQQNNDSIKKLAGGVGKFKV